MIQHSQGFLKPFSGGGYRDLLGGFWNEHGYWMASLWATLGSTALDAGISVSSLVNFCLSELLAEELQLLVRLHHPKWWSWPCLPPALRKQQLLVHSQPAGAAPLAFLNAGRVESFLQATIVEISYFLQQTNTHGVTWKTCSWSTIVVVWFCIHLCRSPWKPCNLFFSNTTAASKHL